MEYPRVTEILRAFTSYDQVPKHILDNAAARGTTVHALCAGIAKGAWLPDGMIGEAHLGYVNSFKLWQQAHVTSFDIIETRYIDEVLGYSGQLDFVIKANDGKLYLVDLKTSAKPQKTYPIQMAAYDRLLKKHGIVVEGAMIVYLNKTGEFPDIDFLPNMDAEFHIFSCALDCWNYFKPRKLNARRKELSAANTSCDE